MSEKDYFGDDWADDLADGEGSQIEYSEELLDESFGEDFEDDLVEVSSPVLGSNLGSNLESKNDDFIAPILPQNEAIKESENEDNSAVENVSENRLPQRPKIAISETPNSTESTSEHAAENAISQSAVSPVISAGVPSESNGSSVDSASLMPDTNLAASKFAEEYFEAEPEGKALAGSALPIITSLPTVPSARTPKRPIRGEVTEDDATNIKIAGETTKPDLVDILKAGIDENSFTVEQIASDSFEIDIDHDPNDRSSEEGDDDREGLTLMTSEDEEELEEDFDSEDDSEDEFEEDEEDFDSEDFDSEDELEEGDGSSATVKKGRIQRTPNSRRKRPGPKRRRGPKPGIRLTARDVYLLMFLARYRVATVAQLARMFGTSETALRNRLPKLEKEKLVSWAWGAQSKPKLWLISRKGLQVINMTLTVPTVKWGQLRHTLGLVDLGIEFELAGEIVITEREIRAAATRYTPTARIKTAVDFMHFVKEFEEEDENGTIKRALTIPMANRSFGHIPDMILARQAYPNGASGNIAIELELNRKQTSEWVAVLTAYRDTELFELVQYYTMNKEIKRALTAIVKALGAEDKIQVHYFIPIDNTADPLITGGK